MSEIAPPYYLITFASYWGSKLGGINAFNTDLLEAVAAGYTEKVHVICVVNKASANEIEEAKSRKVTLISLPYLPNSAHMGEEQAKAAIEQLKQQEPDLNYHNTIWLGHDRITGAAAISASQQTGGRSALVHHMSYEQYEAFAEDSESAERKVSEQSELFKQADILLAVGPLLKNALEDLLLHEVNVQMLIPGLEGINPITKAPHNFSMFVSGRLSPDAEKVKQSQLAIAALASSHKEAKENDQPEGLLLRPKLTLRGVDFEQGKTVVESDHFSATEANLQDFAFKFAKAQIIIKALPYTTDRSKLFDELKKSSVATMTSWHEGFGLVGWEAISAGVPLIISKQSGVYMLLKQNLTALQQEDIWPVYINGQPTSPFFTEEDLNAVNKAIKNIASDPQKARDKALRLRECLLEYTWSNCAETMVNFFNWQIKKGQIHEPKFATTTTTTTTTTAAEEAHTASTHLKCKDETEISSCIVGLDISSPNWDSNAGMAPSVLLKANEAVVPFDVNRQGELDKLLIWAQAKIYGVSLRLITGDGGVGKTRLALELCHNLKAKNWLCGFLQKNLCSNLLNIWQQVKSTSKNVLFVIDYAESRTQELLTLLKLIQQRDNKSQQKFCVLLLARDGGEWWDNIQHQDPTLEGLFMTAGPFLLPPLYSDIKEKQLAYQSALTAFSKNLNLRIPGIKLDLTESHYSKPLYIQMSALLALYGEQANSSEAITKGILNHEKRYWEAATTNIVAEVKEAKNLLTLVTLIGNIPTPKEAKKYWSLLDDTDLTSREFNQLFNSLIPLYPGYQGLQSVKPDLLGEELVTEVLLSPIGPALLEVALSKNTPDYNRRNTLTLLARLTIKKPAVNEVITNALIDHLPHLVEAIVEVAATTTVSRLPELTVLALKQQVNNSQHSVAKQFSALILNDSSALNALSCTSEGIIYERLNKKYQNLLIKGHGNKFDIKELGSSLLNYSVSLGYIGKFIEACKYAKKAMDIRCQSKEELPAKYAMSIGNYAHLLSESGQFNEAAEYGKKSMLLYQDLAEDNPDVYQGDYARSMGNYASHQAQMGEIEDTIVYSKQAYDIYACLAEKEPDKYRARFAITILNYSIRLSELGQTSEALDYGKKGFGIFEELSLKEPDRYQIGYARSMGNLSVTLNELGQYSEGRNYSKKTMDIFENLAKHNPRRYQDEYAQTMEIYSDNLMEVGKYIEAGNYAKKSLEIYEQLVDQSPGQYQFSYAGSLGSYSNYLISVGKYDEALDKRKLAIELFEQFCKKLPLRYSLNLMVSKLSLHLHRWLLDKPQPVNPILLSEYIDNIPIYERSLVHFINDFTKIFLIKPEVAEKEIVIKCSEIIEMYARLPTVKKLSAADCWHCACLLLFSNKEDFSFDSLNKKVWLEEFSLFKVKRNNKLPQWMLDFAKKMKVIWP
jgi:glycosyltransferase involved in cell wall biosynthesis